MAAPLRSQAPARLVQSFSATTPKLPAAGISMRKLHMTGAKEQSPALSNFDSMLASTPRSQITPGSRKFNTSRTLKAVNDSSTVDFAYMPTVSFANPASTEMQQIPLLPDNYSTKRDAIAADAPVIMPEISTTSLGGAVSAMSEAETSKHADIIGMTETQVSEDTGMLKQVWNDFLDDLTGSKKAATV